MNNLDKAVLLSSVIILCLGFVSYYYETSNYQEPFDPLSVKPMSEENTIKFFVCLHNEKVIAENFNFNEPNKYDQYRCWS